MNKIADLNKKLYVSKIGSIDELNDLKNNLVFNPKPERVSKISTFKGICGFHDKKVFSEIEDTEIIPLETQILKFHFRGIAYNYYSKMPILKVLDRFRMAELPEDHFVDSRLHTTLVSAYELFPQIKKEVYDELENFKNAIVHQNKIELSYLFIRINTVPEIMCCETLTPFYDFEGNFLLDKLKTDFDPVNYLLELGKI